MAFAVTFIGASYPVPDTSFVRVDETHWVRVERSDTLRLFIKRIAFVSTLFSTIYTASVHSCQATDLKEKRSRKVDSPSSMPP